MAIQPGAEDRDFPQVLKESYDPDLNRIKVEALVSDGVDALVINANGSINVDIEGLNSFQTSQYTVDITAVQLTPTPLANRSCISIKVKTTSSIDVVYVGNASVTSSTGFALFNGDSIQMDLTAAHSIYVIGTSAGQTVYVMELA
jgi:hypothetical protein